MATVTDWARLASWRVVVVLLSVGSVHGHISCSHSPEPCPMHPPCMRAEKKQLSTVLAQDRFFRVSLSFTLDKQDPQSHHDDVIVRGPQDFHSSFCCRFDDNRGAHGNLNGVRMLLAPRSPGSFMLGFDRAHRHTEGHPCGRGNSAISDA